MKAIGALVAAGIVLASAAGFAQTTDRAPRGPSSEAIYSYCVTRFEGGGQKEVFPSSIARTADTVSLQRYVEYHARTGANSSIAKDANLSSQCGSARDPADAKKRRDLERGRATNLGFLLKPEVVYH